MTGLRRRDSVLAAVEVFRRARPDANITNLLAFLYICENEGLNVTELAQLMGTTNATASRTATVLEGAEAGCGALVRTSIGSRHGHSRVIGLTRQGQVLRERLDGLIEQATPIDPARLDNIASV